MSLFLSQVWCSCVQSCSHLRAMDMVLKDEDFGARVWAGAADRGLLI